MHKILVVLLLAIVTLTWSKVIFEEDFSKGMDHWVVSNFKKDTNEAGEWALSAGKHYSDEKEETGLKTTQDARFYAISTKIPKFSNKGKTLVLQFTVKHEQNIDCGGGYVKLLPEGLDQAEFNGDSEYSIMFGPDICGSSTRRVHFILTKGGKNHLITKTIPCETDEYTHVYTMVLNPDNTYDVLIDGESKQKGSLEEDWEILPPKQIKDPKESKPSDWVDAKKIDDPSDVKPEGWDDIPAEIEDPEASKPEDWDDELDGEWEAPKISNPEFKGTWRPKKIDNPEYKGEWVHPLIDNPDYAADANLHAFDKIGYLGIEIWQVKAGTIFDNFLVADSLDDAQDGIKEANERRESEKKLKSEADEKARNDAKEAEGADDDEDEEDDDNKEEEAEVEAAEEEEVEDKEEL